MHVHVHVVLSDKYDHILAMYICLLSAVQTFKPAVYITDNKTAVLRYVGFKYMYILRHFLHNFFK